MNFGEACFGEIPFGATLEPIGVPIIPEVALLTREIVVVFEIDLIQPHAAAEAE